ncbi:MAG TPA: NADH-quinone oxidoreductase subunit C [Acidimicrobiales bacterium]|nr:NADH-quinone oxidoreductase subunit C [Acidimicrobiales bacterium]
MSGSVKVKELLERSGAVRASLSIASGELADSAATLLGSGYRLALVCAIDTNEDIRVAYLFVSGPPDRRIELVLTTDRDQPRVPSLAHLSFPAGRFEREIHDLFGVVPVGHPAPRRLVLHQHWPEGWRPMRHDAPASVSMDEEISTYPFVEVQGPGVYEIPVGPVHAGLIEPGHFRFSVVGETILKMKARLWFVHKGIERLFEGRDFPTGVELAEKISGDSAVGHSLALCRAIEEALDVVVSPRAEELRVVLLELERLYNHVADIGALCNDVGFGLAQARALTLREHLLRLNRTVTGHRLLRGGVRVGGARVIELPDAPELDAIGELFAELVALARGQGTVMDRFMGTGVLHLNDVEEMGVIGVAARASGSPYDARRAHPAGDPPVGFVPASSTQGDVQARFDVRVDEVATSLGLLHDYCARPGARDVAVPVNMSVRAVSGSGIVEGWRGAIVHRVEFDQGVLTRVKVVDPSFFNWPALAVSLADTIVPDFPLVNKSFNLSYAGNDL